MREQRSFTHMDVDVPFAQTALDLTTPLELAPASLRFGRPVRVVAPSAAQHAAASRGRGRLDGTLASPSLRPYRTGLVVRLAVVGRRIDVKQFFFRWSGEAFHTSSHRRVASSTVRRRERRRKNPDERRSGRVKADLLRVVVLPRQPIADLAERGQLVPAGAHVARPRDSVTFARRLGVVVDGLKRK